MTEEAHEEALPTVRSLRRRAVHCQRLRLLDAENARMRGVERWFRFENMGNANFAYTELAHSMIAMRERQDDLVIVRIQHDGNEAWFVGVPDALVRARVFFADQLTPFRHGGLAWYTSEPTRIAGAYGLGGMTDALAERLVGWWVLHGNPAPWCLLKSQQNAERWMEGVRHRRR